MEELNDKAEELGMGRPFMAGMLIESYHALLGQMVLKAIERMEALASEPQPIVIDH